VGAGYHVAITHGNGPQVGNLLVKNELSAAVVPPVSLDWCVAQTQATIGFVLTDALEAALAARGVSRPVAALVTRTLVDEHDPAFGAPSKPVGRYRTKAEAGPLIEHGQHWQDFGARGWRRVVASPEPLHVLDADVGKTLLDNGTVLIMAGGGGIPVIRREGVLHGVEGVVDKDLTAALLGRFVGCDTLVIATDVDQAVLHWGTPEAQPLGHVSTATLRRHAAAGHFAAGSMGPKVRAACQFADGPGRTAVITRLDRLAEAVTSPLGTVGTVVTERQPSRPRYHEE
jgi:carbamate kinase